LASQLPTPLGKPGKGAAAFEPSARIPAGVVTTELLFED
jgi:hypothetical protein